MKKNIKKINNKNLPTVSVGIPAHNEEKTIKDLISSILNQKQISYRLEKIYVICDGCSDNTAAIAKKCLLNIKMSLLKMTKNAWVKQPDSILFTP